MQVHSTDAHVQAMSCWSLVNILLHPKEKLRVIQCNGPQIVLDAMLRHPQQRQVQYQIA